MKKLVLLLFTFFLVACSGSDEEDSKNPLNLIGTYKSVSGDDCGESWQFGCNETLTITASQISNTDCEINSGSRGVWEYDITLSNSNLVQGDIHTNYGPIQDTFTFDRSSGVLKLLMMDGNCLITETWQNK